MWEYLGRSEWKHVSEKLSLQSGRSHSERVGTFSQLRSISRALSGERGVSEKDWEGARKAVLVQDKRQSLPNRQRGR